eukprot:g1795.t1
MSALASNGGMLHATPQMWEEQVAKAIVILNNVGTTSKDRREADLWLQSFQASSAAWQWADNVLCMPKGRSEAVLFFAAKTMHEKIRQDFTDLPEQQFGSLKESLMRHLHTFSAGPRNVLTRVCLAIAAYAAHTYTFGSIWNGNVVGSLISSLTVDARTMSALVILLRMVFEEATSKELDIPDESRDEFIHSNRQNAPAVFQLIDTCWKSSPTQYQREQVLKCLCAWTYFARLDAQQFAQSPLLGDVGEALRDESIRDEALEVVIELLRAYCHPDHDAPMARQLVPLVMSQRAVLQEALQNEDEDSARMLTWSFVELGHCYMELVVGPLEMSQLMVLETVLHATACSMRTISLQTLTFWEHLRNALEDVPDPELRNRRLGQFAPVIRSVFVACMRHMRRDDDFEAQSSNDKADFFKQRTVIGNCLSDCSYLIGTEQCGMAIAEKLRMELAAIQHGGRNSETWWHDLDATLSSASLLLYDIAASPNECTDAESMMIESILGSIQSLPESHQIRCAATDLIGSCSPWIALRPKILEPMFHYVAKGLTLSDANVASSSARALRALCQTGAQLIATSNLYLSIYEKVSSGSGKSIDLESHLLIIEGMAEVVSKISPKDITEGLLRLLAPMATKLHEDLSRAEQGHANAPTVFQSIGESLQKVHSVMKHTHVTQQQQQQQQQQQHPVVHAMVAMWPLFERVVACCISDNYVMEQLGRVYKYAMRNAGVLYLPLLEKTVNQIVAVFAARAVSDMLYVAAICVDVFAGNRNEAMDAELLRLFGTMSNLICKYLVNLDSVVSEPDLVDDYFILTCRLLKKAPDVVFSPQSKEALLVPLQIGTVALEMSQPDALKSVLAFFEKLLIQGKRTRGSAEIVGAILAQHGPAFVGKIVLGIAGAAQSRHAWIEEPSFCDVLFALGRSFPNAFEQLVPAALASMPAHNANADMKTRFGEKATKALAMSDARHARNVFFDAVAQFGRECRSQLRKIERSKQASKFLGRVQG